MKYHVLNPLDHADWNDRIASLGSESFFNTVEWARVLCDAYGFAPCYVAGEEGGDWSSLLPMMDVNSWLTGRRGVSLPFSDYSESIGLGPSGTGDILGYLKELGVQRKWRYVEIRNDSGFPSDTPSSARYFTHAVDLTPGDQVLFKRLESSVRTSIRKAVNAGVEITFSNALESVREFYRLNCETRRRHGVPPQPFKFFASVHRNVLAKGKGTVVIAQHEGAAVAAAMFFHHGMHVLFKYGASEKRFQALRGSNAVMWEAIRRYAHEGYEQLSLGRTALVNPGLRRFKLGWGAKEAERRYVRYDFRQRQFVSNQEHNSEAGCGLIRRLPLSFSRLAGTLLYKHMA